MRNSVVVARRIASIDHTGQVFICSGMAVLAYFCWIVFTGNFIQVRDTSNQNLSVKKLTVELVLVSILGLVEPWTIYDIFLTINGLSMHLRKRKSQWLKQCYIH